MLGGGHCLKVMDYRTFDFINVNGAFLSAEPQDHVYYLSIVSCISLWWF